jgi:maleate isomerase
MTRPGDTGWYRQQTKALGFITPSANLAVERITSAILADFPDVSAHFSRTPVVGKYEDFEYDYDWDGMLGAARLLAHAKPDVICWNGSKGIGLGFDPDATLCQRITSETEIASTTSAIALEMVLREKNVRTIGVVSPHTAKYQAKMVTAFEQRGWRCLAEAHAGISDNFGYFAVQDETIAAMIRHVARFKPDAIVTLCTNFPSAHLVAPMEEETGIPIYDTVSVGVWGSLNKLGIDTKSGERWGSLFGAGTL